MVVDGGVMGAGVGSAGDVVDASLVGVGGVGGYRVGVGVGVDAGVSLVRL